MKEKTKMHNTQNRLYKRIYTKIKILAFVWELELTLHLKKNK